MKPRKTTSGPTLLLLSVATMAALGCRAAPPAPGSTTEDAALDVEEPRGLRVTTPEATAGYVYFSPLLSGTTYLIDVKTKDEAVKAGRRPELVPEAGLWPDMVVELEPVPPDDARIVWEWHAWDHMIQNHDPDRDNYDDPAAHPGRIDINGDGEAQEMDAEELEQLKALGYVSEDTDEEDLRSDFFHTNAVDYNAELDQIVLSTPRFNEVWVIDHSTTTAEARGSEGGRWGRGGDLLYRWGNPRVHGRGGDEDQLLFAQHDSSWIPAGSPGAGNLTIFNNGKSGPEGDYSAIVEIEPPTSEPGRYVMGATGQVGPSELAWSYEAPDKTSFHSGFISGAQRLPNGHTIICSGAQGRFFEVTPAGEIVWEYWTPFSGNVRNPDGSPPHPIDMAGYAVFRATKIAPDHPALSGRKLRPLEPQPLPIEPTDLERWAEDS